MVHTPRLHKASFDMNNVTVCMAGTLNSSNNAILEFGHSTISFQIFQKNLRGYKIPSAATRRQRVQNFLSNCHAAGYRNFGTSHLGHFRSITLAADL